MMERYKLKTCLLSDEDVRVLKDSLRKHVDSDDITDADRERAHDLCEQFETRFTQEGE